MHHKATVSEGKAETRPVHVECSCGTAGDFATEAEAYAWMQSRHFARLAGVSTTEFVPSSSAPPESSEGAPEESPSEETVEVVSPSEETKKKAAEEKEAPPPEKLVGETVSES